MGRSQYFLLVSLAFAFLASANAVLNLNVLSFGAKTDGKTDSTQAFLKAWTTACASNQTVQIAVPSGRYLIKQILFKGPCKNNATSYQIGGTLIAPHYKVLNTANWIYFSRVYGLSIIGGTLDGQGAAFWACRASGKGCPVGARNLAFNSANNILIKGLTTINSQYSHIVINKCKNIMMQSLMVIAPADSPNTDGIHIQFSTGVTIRGTTMKTGDDCVSIGPGTTNLLVEGGNCGPGHGISIGSLGKTRVEEGVQNVTVRKVIFTESDNGVRIKSWARPSIGFVKGVLYQNIIMKNVRNPIIIDQHYCPRNENCPGQESGIRISDITYQNIQGSSSTRVATNFDCSHTTPCKNIRLQMVRLTYQNTVAHSSCLNAAGTSTGTVSPEKCL